MKPFKFTKKNREYIKWGKNTKEVRIFPKPKLAAVPVTPLEMVTDDAVAQGVYSNLAAIAHTETEFVADFFFLAPNQHKLKAGARVILSPSRVKSLCAALREEIKKYEARFGPVKDAGGPRADPAETKK